MFPLYPEASKAVTYGRNRPKPLSSTTEFKRTVKTSTTNSCSTPPSARPEVSLISKKTYFAIKMADSQRRCSQWSDDNLKWSFYKKFKIHKSALLFYYLASVLILIMGAAPLPHPNWPYGLGHQLGGGPNGQGIVLHGWVRVPSNALWRRFLQKTCCSNNL